MTPTFDDPPVEVESSHLSTSASAATLRQRHRNTGGGDTPLSPKNQDASSDMEHGDGVKSDDDDEKTNEEEVTWGKTPSGEVFRVPQTHDFLHTLLHTLHRSTLTRVTFLTLISQPILFYLWRHHPNLRSTFFLIYFTFWRGMYDWGFAWALRRQSEKKWIVRWLRKRGWLDTKSEQGGEEGRIWAKWWKRELEMKMGEGYKWEDVPQEFNAWLIFRQLVDLVLLNDFVSYSCFAWANLNFPAGQSTLLHIFRWVFGWSLIFFNLWVKVDAHRVVKDYAWYWGDAFWLMVMQHDLVFDGVYEIAPHPMYSVGYAGYYGISMVVGSYTVLFVSLAAHAAQFAFLLWFENPHIERTYGGGKKPLASRIPLSWGEKAGSSKSSSVDQEVLESATPAATEGETETEPELPELPEIPAGTVPAPEVRKNRSDSSFSSTSVSTTPTGEAPYPKKPVVRSRSNRHATRRVTMHDLTHRFFRKPTVILARLDIFRSTDFALAILLIYSLSSLVPALPPQVGLGIHFLHALGWRLFHSYGLGLLLRAQSKSKWLVRHYLKHYHYPNEASMQENEGLEREGVVKRATEEAFRNWQVGYNISLVMTYVSFAGLAWKTYHLPGDWTVSGTGLRHVLGASLIALHLWAAASSYEVLGDFGWFYSDFFLIEQIPSQLAYTGIYRFLNNPEQSMGGAAFFGLWLISWSKLVLTLAVFSHISHWWFLSCVERPHMKKLYGDRLRKDGGLTKTLKSVAGKTLADKAGKHAPEISRVVQEVRGSIERVEERVTEAVEEFLDHARPVLADMVNDTRILLQQSRERMIITRVASDMSAYDTSRYSLKVAGTSSSPCLKFKVGQPIQVQWTAPSNHSRKDWIGLYRLGSCRSNMITRISSMGKWMPIFEDEWVGDEYIVPKGDVKQEDSGSVVFQGDQLPWAEGKYELRYHHDGKHNVMSRVAPIEIEVTRPIDPASFKSVRSCLLDMVTLALDNNPALLPASALKVRASPYPSPNLDLKTPPSHNLKSPALSATPSSPDLLKPSDMTAGDAVKGLLGTDPIPSSLSDSSSKAESLQQQPQSNLGSEAAVGDESVEMDEEGRDPDDFAIMDEKQAKRIVSMCEAAFDVELTVDVVVADANVSALAKRVMGARSLVRPGG